MRQALVLVGLALAACGRGGAPAGPGDDPPDDQPPGPLASIGGCQVFPADNPWNRDISADPVHPTSDALIRQMAPDNPLHLDLGTTEEYYGIPYTVVPAGQPPVPIRFGTDGVDYSDESDPGPMPIPLSAPIEGGSTTDPNPSSGDRHLLVVRQGDCTLYELYNTVREGDGFRVSSSAIWPLGANHIRPAGWTSADAAGLPIFPAVIRYDELKRGVIDHAMRVTVRRTRRAYVYPATHFASRLTDENLPRMGERIRLKKEFDISKFSPEVQTILTGLKRYGMLVADNGNEWAISCAPDPRIPVLHAELRKINGSDFEVVVPPQGYVPAK